jgi:hypothetical protein
VCRRALRRPVTLRAMERRGAFRRAPA